MHIISVVRDFELYENLIRTNPYLSNATFYPFDNRIENKSISIRYNQFLKTYDYTQPSWLIFCHEDWEINEDLEKKLARLNKASLYGPIGTTFDGHYEEITHSHKSNIKEREVIGIYCIHLKKAMTFDCQCMIVHSDLIRKYNLRFDENLSFDLYVEDFCIYAREKYNIKSYVLQLNCHHYSKGNLKRSFYEQFQYLQNKYKHSKKCYISTCSNEPIGSKRAFQFYTFIKKITKKFYYNEVTYSGKHLIKICKIPVYSKKVR